MRYQANRTGAAIAVTGTCEVTAQRTKSGALTTAEAEYQEKAERISVCHVVSGDLWAGAEVQVASLVRGLSGRGDVDVCVVVLNEGRLAAELREGGIEVCVIPEDRYGFLQILKRAAAFLEARQVQVIHSHRYKENLLAVMLSRRLKIPVRVRTQHGWPEPVKGLKAIHSAGLMALDRFCGRTMTDSIIGVSAEMMPRLERIYGSSTVLVRNSIDLDAVRSSLSREEAKARLHVPVDAPLVGMAGRLEPVKRVDLFLESAAQLLRDFPNAHFAIAGTGSIRRELESQAKSLGLQERVHFLGHREDVWNVLRAMDVLVMCSDSEGLPIVLLEAFWLRVPVVGRAVAGIRELVGENECGLAVESCRPEDFASAISRLLREPELARRFSSAAAQRVEREFGVDRAVDEMSIEYRRLLRRRSGVC